MLGGVSNGCEDSSKSTGDQSELTESIVELVGRGEEHLELVWNLVPNPVVWSSEGV